MKSITNTVSILNFGVGRNGHSTLIPLSSLIKDAVGCFLKCNISQGHESTVTLANWVNMAEASWWNRRGWLCNFKVFHRKACGRQSVNLRVSMIVCQLLYIWSLENLYRKWQGDLNHYIGGILRFITCKFI